jgi:adenylate kinase family enzyme
VTGPPLSGKTTLTNYLKKHLGSSRVAIVDYKEHEEAIKKTLGSAEEPFEGKVPLAKIEDSMVESMRKDKKAERRVTYVFDGFPGQPTGTEFARFVREKLRCPADFIISCQV